MHQDFRNHNNFCQVERSQPFCSHADVCPAVCPKPHLATTLPCACCCCDGWKKLCFHYDGRAIHKSARACTPGLRRLTEFQFVFRTKAKQVTLGDNPMVEQTRQRSPKHSHGLITMRGLSLISDVPCESHFSWIGVAEDVKKRASNLELDVMVQPSTLVLGVRVRLSTKILVYSYSSPNCIIELKNCDFARPLKPLKHLWRRWGFFSSRSETWLKNTLKKRFSRAWA